MLNWNHPWPGFPKLKLYTEGNVFRGGPGPVLFYQCQPIPPHSSCTTDSSGLSNLLIISPFHNLIQPELLQTYQWVIYFQAVSLSELEDTICTECLLCFTHIVGTQTRLPYWEIWSMNHWWLGVRVTFGFGWGLKEMARWANAKTHKVCMCVRSPSKLFDGNENSNLGC